jgi:NRAMP (natural resistance-associated macrophage protein)-like metal ion transporter
VPFPQYRTAEEIELSRPFFSTSITYRFSGTSSTKRDMSERAIEDPSDARRRPGATDFLFRLGPGLITGAADDDPSGIATYSQAGATFGFGLLWTMVLTFPLMAAIQEICGRFGRITGTGIAESLRKCYPRPLVYSVVLLLCVANTFNLGADVAAMGSAAQLVLGGKASLYAVGLGLLSVILEVAIPYRKYVLYLKWLTLVLFAYVATAFVVHVPWLAVLKATVIPSFEWKSAYWMAIVAVLGTTISPYLFFWQSSQEAEDVRLAHGESALKKKPSQASWQFRRIAMDTRLGMAISNLVAFFIILTTAVTLHGRASQPEIKTAADAAEALRPLAGHFAFLLFALGIVGTGLLAVPVLAGSTAYAVSETFHWRASLESKPKKAPRFYGVIAAATILGIALNSIGLDPIRALYWSAVLNGIVAVPLMFVLMIMSTNEKIVGQFRLSSALRTFGWLATIVMLAASLGFLISVVRGLK